MTKSTTNKKKKEKKGYVASVHYLAQKVCDYHTILTNPYLYGEEGEEVGRG